MSKISSTAICAVILSLLFGTVSLTASAASGAGSGRLWWQRTFGGAGNEVGHAVKATSDGGYIVVGRTDSYGSGGADVWLVKTDASGNQEWSRTYGGAYQDEGFDVLEAPDGGYVIAGQTASYGLADPSQGFYDAWLLKVDRDGEMLWSKTFGGSRDDVAYALCQSPDGGYVFAGRTNSTGSGGYDVWVTKVDAIGALVWSKTFGGGGNDSARSVSPASDGGYILAGHTRSYGAGDADIWLVKLGENGDKQWDRTFGGAGADYGESVIQAGDGGYIITGATFSYGAGSADAWLIKVSADGDMLWDRTFGGNGFDSGYDVRPTPDGGYAIAGSTRSYGAGGSDIWLIKTDAGGNRLWSQTFGGPGWDEGTSLYVNPTGAYAIAGETASYGAGNTDLWLLAALPASGDADGNGVIDAADIVKTERVIAGLDMTTAAADANLDGRVNAIDITVIERLIAGLDR